MFIEALILLDGVKGSLLNVPEAVRKSYAATWVKCYDQLGNSDIAQYRARTALINGIGG